ncbi:MAG TPA: serine acetyltransferase [Methylophilaceae bacterium]|nr:serine acetyltransferase [Methylophilaceae bacterium]HAJ71288.1 serine acetyltransferase [Methylophilaceae bacterium]
MTEPIISVTEPDWSREKKSFFEWSPSKSLLASIRSYQRQQNTHFLLGWVFKKVAVIQHRFWSVVTGAEIPINSQIGGGLLIPHPNGIVIHPAASIGPNCLILQQVTIGVGASDGFPEIGGHVDIGAGAKVLGAIKIGNHAKIGANAVVLIDVPEGQTAVGIPAKLLSKK